jgi:hypothetical protein
MKRQTLAEKRAFAIKLFLGLGVAFLAGLSLYLMYMPDLIPNTEEGKRAYALAEQELERNFPNKKFDSDLTYTLESVEEDANGVWEFRYTPKSPLGGTALDADVNVYVDLSKGTARLEHVGGA